MVIILSRSLRSIFSCFDKLTFIDLVSKACDFPIKLRLGSTYGQLDLAISEESIYRRFLR